MGIFDEQISRKPNLYPWAQEFIDKLHENFWTDREFNAMTDGTSSIMVGSAKRFATVYHSRSTVLLPSDQSVAKIESR